MCVCVCVCVYVLWFPFHVYWLTYKHWVVTLVVWEYLHLLHLPCLVTDETEGDGCSSTLENQSSLCVGGWDGTTEKIRPLPMGTHPDVKHIITRLRRYYASCVCGSCSGLLFPFVHSLTHLHTHISSYSLTH